MRPPKWHLAEVYMFMGVIGVLLSVVWWAKDVAIDQPLKHAVAQVEARVCLLEVEFLELKLKAARREHTEAERAAIAAQLYSTTTLAELGLTGIQVRVTELGRHVRDLDDQVSKKRDVCRPFRMVG